MVNIIGNSVAAIVIARWEGAYNAEQAAMVLDRRISPASSEALP
jgi:Na+/H+-dicarboxylate symporter